MLQKGGHLFGNLELAGIGCESLNPCVESLAFSRCAGFGLPSLFSVTCACRYRADNAEHNHKLLEGLKEGPHSAELLKLTREDAAKGRMSEPRPAADVDLGALRLHPRFGVEQGVKADGTLKLRAVDNLSWSGKQGKKRRRLEGSVNGHCRIPEVLHHDHIDVLMEAATSLQEDSKEPPGLWKADIDSAFRRIPICCYFLWAAAVAFMVDGKVPGYVVFLFLSGSLSLNVIYVAGGQPWVAEHFAMPFGAKASVFAWERMGHFIATVARRLLKLPVLRYVDDFSRLNLRCAFRSIVRGFSLGCLARAFVSLLGVAGARGQLFRSDRACHAWCGCNCRRKKGPRNAVDCPWCRYHFVWRRFQAEGLCSESMLASSLVWLSPG